MLRSKILAKLLLPLLSFCIFIYPYSGVSASPVFASIQLEVNHSLPIYQSYDLSSYDNILHLIEDITNGNIQDKSPEQLEQINRVLALLVEQGSLTGDPTTLQEDISELLGLHLTPYGYDYTRPGAILCGGWVKKQWKKTKKFVKKHKTAIIIGAAIVVAVVVVAGITYGATAAAGSALGSSAPEQKEPTKIPNVRSSSQKQIENIKETIANISEEEILEPIDPNFPIEDNARILGELLVYQNLDQVTEQNYQEIQKAFSGNYLAHAVVDTTKNFEENFHQMRGDYALQREHYEQALYDFNKIIETDPSNSDAYLSRASAYERIGDYPAAITDYEQYLTQAKHTWDCTSDFTVGFTKGLASGVKDAGVEFGGFIADAVIHPINTSADIWKSCCLLKELAASAEWGTISEVISPDVHKLITSWDELSMEQRGEYAGHAFGKHGGDFFIPGATSKVVSAGLSEIKQLGKVCKTLKNAEKALVLEGLVEEGAARTIAAGKELGLTSKEMSAFKQSGELEQVIGKGRDFFAGNLELQASFDRFQNAEKFLQNYKEFMPESQAHELIRKTGIKTFARPTNIPTNFRVKITNYGAGIKYIHPNNEQTYIRVMPGKPHSRNPAQQKPYITWMKNGKTLDKNGNVVNKKLLESHIPLEEFKYTP